MSALEDRAQELAARRIDEVLQEGTPENVLANYLSELTKCLKIPEELRYSEAAAQQLWETHQREAKLAEKEKCLKELQEKNETVKRIFLDNAYAEHSAAIYKFAKDINSARTDDAIYYVGDEKPKRLGWDETIKDTHPKSKLQYSLKDWVNGLSLFECWSEREAAILHNLKERFPDRPTQITQMDDVKTGYRWAGYINIKFKGEPQ